MKPLRRLAVLTEATSWGGAEQQLSTLLGGLPTDVQARVLGPSREVVDRLVAAAASADGELLPAATGRLDLRAVRTTAAALRRAAADVVHVNLSWTGGSRSHLLAAVRSGAPVVAVDHLPQPVPTMPGRLLARALAAGVHRYVTVTASSARTAEQVLGLRSGSVVAVPNGVPLAPVSGPHDRPALRVVTVARLEPRKGIDVLLRAIAATDGTLDVAGDGPERAALERLAGELAVADRVTFHGQVGDVASLLAGADVFALSSYAEALPLSLLEAAAAGLPVIASDVGGVRDAVIDDATGFVVPVGDPAAITDALKRLGDSEIRARLGAAGRARVATDFSVDAMVAGYLEVYAQACRVGCRLQRQVAARASAGPALPAAAPVDLAELEALVPPAEVRPPTTPVSVVVATVGREAALDRCLRSLLASAHRELEVVVVDDGVDAASVRAVVERLQDPRLVLLPSRRPGASAARNTGAAVATSPLLAFTDDDIEVDPAWVGALAARAETDAVAAVTGLTLPLELDVSSQVWFERFAGFGRGLDPFVVDAASRADVPRLFPYSVGNLGGGGNLLVRRDLFERVGGFDERLGPGTPTFGGEDLDLICRLLLAGASIAYEPRAVVRHAHRRDDGAVNLQAFTYGAGLTAQLAVHWRDPRLLGLIARSALPIAQALLTGRAAPATTTTAIAATDVPAALRRRELLGYLYGPLALAHSAGHRRRAVLQEAS